MFDIFSRFSKHMLFLFVKCLLVTRRMFLCESCTLGTLVYDGQFSSVTIYKVSKCMMPSVLNICSD